MIDFGIPTIVSELIVLKTLKGLDKTLKEDEGIEKEEFIDYISNKYQSRRSREKEEIKDLINLSLKRNYLIQKENKLYLKKDSTN